MTTDLPPDEALFSVFPEWRSLARLQTAADGEVSMTIAVPAAVEADVAHGLIIVLSADEVTVCFDLYHSHFNPWFDDDDGEGIDDALEFIEQLMAERIVVVSWLDDDRWCGSSACPPGAELDAPTSGAGPRFNRVRVRSWRGTFNIDIAA